MTETNGTTNGTANAKQTARLTHKMFYSLCEMMHQRREVLLNERPTLKDAAAILSTHLGFPVTSDQVAEAQEATGITWTAKRAPRKAPCDKSERARRMAVVVRAVGRLYKKLGEEMGDELNALYEDALYEDCKRA